MRDTGPLDMDKVEFVKPEMTNCWFDAALAGEDIFFMIAGRPMQSVRPARADLIADLMSKRVGCAWE